MGYDLHFEDGRHEWHNIWAFEALVLLLAYVEDKITKQDLFDKLTTLNMAQQPSVEAFDKSKVERDEETGKPLAKFTVYLQRFSSEEIKFIEDAIFDEEHIKNNAKMFYYGARIVPQGKCTKEEMEAFKEKAGEAIAPILEWRTRMDDHCEMMGIKEYDPLFHNDGQKLQSHTCLRIMAKIMMNKSIIGLADEYYPMGDIVRLVGHFAYAAGNNISITVK